MLENSSLTDEQLIEQVKTGSTTAFASLYERHKSHIYNYLYHFFGNKQLAEDCTQDVFIHMHDKAALYNPTSKFSSWLYKMAKNLALDTLRKNKIRQARSLDEIVENEDSSVSLYEVLESPTFDARTVAESAEYVELLKKAISMLSDTDRQVVILCDIQEMPYKEVADVLNCPEKSVAVKLFRARQRLAKILKPKGSF